MTVYVLSTMTDSVSYVNYNYIGDANSKAGQLPMVRDKVTILGGANLPSMKSGFGDMTQNGEGQPMWTASGVVTPVSDEKYELIKDHWLFKKHQEGGHVKVLNKDITDNHKAVKREISDMEKRDKAAQLTPETLKMKVKVKLNEMEPDAQFRL